MPPRAADRALTELLSTVDEAQKRWFVGGEAMLLGHGGVKRIVRTEWLVQTDRAPGHPGLKARHPLREPGRVRQAGGGRKFFRQQDPEVFQLLEQIMEESTAGNPMLLLKWSSKSTYQIRDQLVAQGHPISEDTVACRLEALDHWGTRLVFGYRPPEFTPAQAPLEARAQEWLGPTSCYCYTRRAE